MRCCYEAGPTGYGLARHLRAREIACDVVAPGLVPVRPGDQIKTDPRDARKLARLHAGGLLEAITVPYGIRSVLCEGGPLLNAALLRDHLVDELFLSIAAKLSGETIGPGIVAPLHRGDTTDLQLLWALQAGHDLFLRYVICSTPA